VKKIVFLGHSYHKETRSSDFFLEILRRNYEVTVLYDETWTGGLPLDISSLSIGIYDAIVLWQQINYAFHPDIKRHPNVILIPMYDCHANGLSFFRQFSRHDNYKFINFCRAQHEACRQFGLDSLSVRYFPDPQGTRPNSNLDNLVGFFWPRRHEINWRLIKKLISRSRVSRLFYHAAPDRGFPRVIPTDADRKNYHITITEWFTNKSEFHELLDLVNIYFAPRLYEGIGMSFLEAMAKGMCVVAPDNPTMNEYIVHGVNGLLYDPCRPQPLDFSRASELGTRARRSIERGYQYWLGAIDDILEFIEHTPGARTVQRAQSYIESTSLDISASSTQTNLSLDTSENPTLKADLTGGLRVRGQSKRNTKEYPLITVATVTRNAEHTLPLTLASIFTQDYENMELIIVDGASSDGTLNIVRENEHRIDLWVSEPDSGPYDAMNKAALLARGEWIIFLNTGDSFALNDVLRQVLKDVPGSADIVYGHHYYRQLDGKDFWHRANDFGWTCEALRSGHLSDSWIKGVPCHQATLTRTTLLRAYPYNTERFSYAADHDFLFKMERMGRTFFHTDITIAVYNAGGLSWQNADACRREQWEIARKYGSRRKVDKFYSKRIKNEQREVRRPYLSFSPEWYDEESCWGGWLRWLAKDGEITLNTDEPVERIVYFQARSLWPENVLTVKLDGEILFRQALDTKFAFIGPKKVFFDKKEHVFRFSATGEPDISSCSDTRLLGIAVKDFSVATATQAAALHTLLLRAQSTRLAYAIARAVGILRYSNHNNLSMSHLLKMYLIIRWSGLFSPKYYRDQCRGRYQGKERAALMHYIVQGASERLNPNPFFDTGFYLDRNPDIAARGINPLYHYVLCGAREGREPSPLVSMAEYLEQNPDLDPKRMNPLRHYIKHNTPRSGVTIS